MASPLFRRAVHAAPIAFAVAWVGVLVLAPLAAMVVHAFGHGLGDVMAALASPRVVSALGLSIKLAAIAVVVNTVAGIAIAYVLVRHRFWGRRLFNALIDLPLATSPVVAGLMLLLLFGPGGWLAGARDLVGEPILFNTPAMILATVFVTSPFVVREVGPLLAAQGTDEEEAAATLGARPLRIFFGITLPKIRWGLAYGVILTCARGLGEFGAVLVVSGAILGHTETATIFIEMSAHDRDPVAPFAVALALALMAAVLFLSMEILKRARRR
ncbi:MAG TPA: sulfate ABC transporter permease subunit [Kofleriaceae bacterium]|nr:sulfate ABC transporter permease subunit [Kofleriaceae bacterium]